MTEARNEVTPDWLKEVVRSRHLRFWPLRECSLCFAPIGYHFSPDGSELAWDGRCDCSSAFGPERREWEELAHSFNIQNDEWLGKMRASFETDGDTYSAAA